MLVCKVIVGGWVCMGVCWYVCIDVVCLCIYVLGVGTNS